MTVIEMARELGKALQEDERYKKYQEAKVKNDKDVELQNMIGEFNVKRMQLNQEMQKKEKDADAIKHLDSKLKETYNKIMANPNMAEFTAAQEKVEKLINSVNFIISSAANGEDPMTCPEEQPASCGGSCSTCGGCH